MGGFSIEYLCAYTYINDACPRKCSQASKRRIWVLFFGVGSGYQIPKKQTVLTPVWGLWLGFLVTDNILMQSGLCTKQFWFLTFEVFGNSPWDTQLHHYLEEKIAREASVYLVLENENHLMDTQSKHYLYNLFTFWKMISNFFFGFGAKFKFRK